jgi:hypothetical protein
MKPNRIVASFVLCLFASSSQAQKPKSPKPSTAGPIVSNNLFIQTIPTIKQATVAIACIQTKLTGEIALASIEGTGFFISNDGTFVTAAHVYHGLSLSAPPRQQICEAAGIYVSVNGWSAGNEIAVEWLKIKECRTDDDLDLAVCRTINNPFTWDLIKAKPLFVSFDTATQPEGTEIAFTGFPLSTPQPITARGTIGTYWGYGKEEHPREIVIEHGNWPGASGAPVYLANGKVIGLILKRGLNEATGLAFARSAYSIQLFLQDNKFFPSDKTSK